MGRLDGKVVVITGAGGGMGREAALLSSQEGAGVCVADADHAAALTAIGMPAFACTPDRFPDLMAAAIERRDLSTWHTISP